MKKLFSCLCAVLLLVSCATIPATTECEGEILEEYVDYQGNVMIKVDTDCDGVCDGGAVIDAAGGISLILTCDEVDYIWKTYKEAMGVLEIKRGI